MARGRSFTPSASNSARTLRPGNDARAGLLLGIENYSRHLDGRSRASRPTRSSAISRADYLLIIDESHISVPQVGAMFKGDRSRKDKLVEYGFRLPCARDNRPLTFDEFEEPDGPDDLRERHAREV
jgi:excinuclease UvrABC helicase subunit UvrB